MESRKFRKPFELKFHKHLIKMNQEEQATQNNRIMWSMKK